ncbi:MAG: ATP-binding protein [Bryobacteraceae bacterium]|jgi:nitrogen fixation/metabolism regulation signal transduction histidine kinase
MRRLRTRLIFAFAASTLVPVAITFWVSLSLLDRSLEYNAIRELDETSQALAQTGREYYRAARTLLKQHVAEKKLEPVAYPAAQAAQWPADVRDFHDGGEAESFALAGNQGDRLDYLLRRGDDVLRYSMPLNGVSMGRLSAVYSRSRAVLDRLGNPRRGLFGAFLAIAIAVWLASLAVVVYWAHRISQPIRELTSGLSEVAGGNLEYRVASSGDDEIGAAVHAFNRMTSELQHARDRLVQATRLESWQAVARKMAHEVKNSLTPIRLTMEEIAARGSDNQPEFLQQAAQIVVDEVTALERRVSAFSQFANEPPVCPSPVDVNSLLEDRIAFLRKSHPEVSYQIRLCDGHPLAFADEDLVRGVVTNLLENAAQAARPGGSVLSMTATENGHVRIEVHDSGPGLSALARSTLFQPTISFKQNGMGLGLSIAHKGAVLSGGDIQLVPGELGGAAFRVLLPRAKQET